MLLNMVQAIRLRLATSQRVVDALNGTYTNSPWQVTTGPDPRVKIGWSDQDKCAGNIYLVPEGDATLEDTPRSDGGLGVFCYDATLEEVMRCIEAVGRELRDPIKGCVEIVDPPTTKIGRLFFGSRGAPFREADEKRLWVAPGVIDGIWFVQPNT